MSHLISIQIDATMDEVISENYTRYAFTLTSAGGDVSRSFLIDVPNGDEGTCDVWVNDSTVAVGDTPEDGFATFTPVTI